tara:strand:- start:7270 stop:8184 length:915 start_codon:yes stop_codon:yes gene_type:complete
MSYNTGEPDDEYPWGGTGEPDDEYYPQTSSGGGNQSRCIVDNLGGERHPYGYCIKPLEEMIDYDKIRRESGPFNMVGLTEGTAGMINYGLSLVSNPQNAISDECSNKLGNKYVLKSDMKCKNMPSENVHTFIDNNSNYNYLTQRKDNTLGIIPATVGSAMRINGAPLVKALYSDPLENCIKVTLPCHLVDHKNSANNYTGNVDNIPITVSQYDELIKDNSIRPTASERRERERLRNSNTRSGYTNLYDSIHNYLDKNPILLNNNHDENKNIEKTDFDQDMLFNLYYLLLSIFLLIILFKLLKKK